MKTYKIVERTEYFTIKNGDKNNIHYLYQGEVDSDIHSEFKAANDELAIKVFREYIEGMRLSNEVDIQKYSIYYTYYDIKLIEDEDHWLDSTYNIHELEGINLKW